MKIARLKLLSFGPFTDTVLELGKGNEGLHIIYGLNEAGKSAALRAIRQALFGIPERSTDNFIHPYARMRIGVVLRHSDGIRLEFVRRKGRGNTLRGNDDETLMDETLLHGFLGGVSADIFGTMFCIDHAELVKGGQEIIEGGGNIGQALFAAASGISDLHQNLAELQAEADTLFRPSGQKPRINFTITELRYNQKKLRDAQLPGQTWLEHDRALRIAEQNKIKAERDLDDKQRERHRLERIREALPDIARRKELLDELEGYIDSVILPEDFGDRRRELLTNLRVAESVEKQALESMEVIDKALETLEVSESLLDNAESIQQLYQELGSHRKAAGDRTKLLTQRSTLESDAKTILLSLPVNVSLQAVDTLRLGKAEIVLIQELGSEHERSRTRLKSACETISKLTFSIEGIERQLKVLEDPKDTGQLRRALEQARQQGPIEEQYHSQLSEIETSVRSAEVALYKQSLWSGTMDALEKLPIPPVETIDAFESRLGEARSKVNDLGKEIDRLDRGLVETEGQIERLRIEQEVPTEEDLEQARLRRDHGWQLVRRLWLEGEKNAGSVKDFVSSLEPALTLAEAYELSVERADEVADRLRREADRVANKATLLSERETGRSHCERLKSKLEKAETELKKANEEWSAVWQATGISPKSPREMRAWAQDMSLLTEEVLKIRLRQARAEDLKSYVKAHRKELVKCLQSLGETAPEEEETLTVIISRCEQVIERRKEARSKREQLIHDIDQRREELLEALKLAGNTEQELSSWRTQWARAIQPLGLGADASPAQANALVADFSTLLEKVEQADILRKRIEGIDRDMTNFSGKVTKMAEHVARDLKQLAAEQAAAELNARLTQARTAKSERQSFQKQRSREEKQLRGARSNIAEIQSQLDAMCQEAGCSNHEQLQEAERRSVKRGQIDSELEALQVRLRKLSGGATVEDFVKECQAVDPDGLDVRIDRLTESIRALDEEKSALDRTIGTELNELSKMDGSAHAAGLAEESQRLMAGLESDVEQYVRLRLASTVLGHAIERYREKHQGPVLMRASELFSQMTRQSFDGIRAEFDHKGDAVLMGVRQGGKEIVGVEGMSDGTADQLYLALRLASLETYLEGNEQLPFIVDDILIRFDDERATASLQVLAELSAKTQIIFFSHHQHLLELAEAHVDPKVLFKHSLGI